MKRIILAGTLAVLVGCGQNPPKIERVVVVEKEYVTLRVRQDVLDRCVRPTKIREAFPSLQSEAPDEKALLTAYVESHTNEVNCFLVKKEVERSQRDAHDTVGGKNVRQLSE